MRSIFQQQETACTPAAAAAPSSPLLWIPLDEVRQAWASFGAEALSAPALLATATAFRALSWEASALRYHGLACQAEQRGGRFQGAAAPWLDQVILNLGEALRDWRNSQVLLDRLATRETCQACTEPVEQVQALSEQVAAQQERLHHLLEQIRQERSAYDGRRVAVPTVAPTAHQAGGGTSHVA